MFKRRPTFGYLYPTLDYGRVLFCKFGLYLDRFCFSVVSTNPLLLLLFVLFIELGKLECVLDPFVLAFSVETMRFHNGGYRVAKRDLDIF